MFPRRSTTIIGTLVIISLFSSACDSRSPNTRKTDTKPVVDQPPYWYQLVPRDSLSRVTGVSGTMHEVNKVDILQPYSLCEVQSSTQEPLITTLAIGERAKGLADDEYRRPRSRITLPSMLGKAAYAPLDGHTA